VISTEQDSLGRREVKTRAFASEANLVESFVKALRRGAPQGWSLMREIDAGVGIADLILVPALDRPSPSQRLLRTVPLRLAPLLAPTTSRKVVSVSAFMSQTGMSRSSALKAVGALAAIGLARREGDLVELKAVTEAPYKDVVAIEAKLRDWGRALTQAYRNRQFATQSWVVLDAHYPLSELALAAFKQANVGLATCSTEGDLRIRVAAKTKCPSSKQRMWTAQALIARSFRQALRPLK
jgi:hypothetical protein